jgi:hypothetical protein
MVDDMLVINFDARLEVENLKANLKILSSFGYSRVDAKHKGEGK